MFGHIFPRAIWVRKVLKILSAGSTIQETAEALVHSRKTTSSPIPYTEEFLTTLTVKFRPFSLKLSSLETLPKV